MIIKCAGCFIDIDYELGESLCPECFEDLCGIKTSYEDCPNIEEIESGKKEKVHKEDDTKGCSDENIRN